MMSDVPYPSPSETTGPDNLTELFPYEVPFRVSMASGVIIVALFAVALIGAIFAKVPESVSAPFQLVPQEGAEPIVASRAGTLEDIRVSEGTLVEEGDPLFAIRSDQIREWATELESLEQDVASLDERRAATEMVFETKEMARKGEMEEHESKLQYQREYLAAYQDVVSRMREMRERGLVSEVEVLGHELGLAEAKRDVALARQAAEMARLNFEILETERSAEMSQEDIEQERLLSRINALRDLLKDAEGDRLYVRAPYEGIVLTVAEKRTGDPVGRGEELCQIASTEAQPRAKLRVAQEAVPRLRVGQPVKLYFAAFPYQRYGTVSGRLDWLSPAAVKTPRGPEFIGYVELDDYTIRTGEGAAPLRVGMGGEARVNVGRRTLIEYAFEPIRQLREELTPAQSDAPMSLPDVPYVPMEDTDQAPTP